MNPLDGMTSERWESMTPEQRERIRDLSGLSPQLVGLEGCRVQVVENEGDAPRRFKVGRSTGWRPCHLEVHNARARGGQPARNRYYSVRVIRAKD